MKRGFVLLSLLLLATACEKNSYKTFSTKYKVFFSCDISTSPYNQTTAGRFLSIRKKDGKLHMKDSDGKKYDQELTAIQSGSFIFGLAGIIIGTPTLDNYDQSIWAYDLGCPECDSPTTCLTFGFKGQASCSICNGTWDLNNNGYSTDGKSRPLYRYPTSLNNGILTVSN